jgi:hypothetical protein
MLLREFPESEERLLVRTKMLGRCGRPKMFHWYQAAYCIMACWVLARCYAVGLLERLGSFWLLVLCLLMSPIFAGFLPVKPSTLLSGDE